MGGNTDRGNSNRVGEGTVPVHDIINHQAATTKASTRIILIYVYDIFRLLIGVPDYSSESYHIEKNKN